MPLIHCKIRHAAKTDTPAGPRLLTGPLNALVEVARFPLRKQIHKSRRAAGPPYVNFYQRIPVWNKALWIGKFVVLITIA